MDKIHEIAVIGAGPAGIATSCEAVICGIKEILVFEKSTNHSDTIRKYFKDNKPVDRNWKGLNIVLEGHIDFQSGTKETTLDLFDESLENNLIDAKFHTEVIGVERLDNIFKINTISNEEFYSKNIVIAIGRMGKPNKPNYPIPASLRQKANHNIRFCTKDEKILVVGGGDSACEFAYFIHKSNDVTLNYRGAQITKANPKNLQNVLDIAEENKLSLKFGVDIDKLEDENGSFKVFYTDGSVELYDRIIYALGGSSPTEFLEKCSVKLDENGKPIADENNYNSEGIYVAGDIAGSIGGSIAAALSHGYKIVNSIKG